MNDTPIILGADGNPIERELPTVTAIFAELMLGHPGNEGLTVDPEKACAALKEKHLVAVKLPPNCVIADAAALPNESAALVAMANRAVEVLNGKGSVRLPVPEQAHWAKAFIVLFQRLNQSRVDRMRLAGEFRQLFEAHAQYETQVAEETAAREAAFTEAVRAAFLAGQYSGADLSGGGALTSQAYKDACGQAADAYVKALSKDPEPEPRE